MSVPDNLFTAWLTQMTMAPRGEINTATYRSPRAFNPLLGNGLHHLVTNDLMPIIVVYLEVRWDWCIVSGFLGRTMQKMPCWRTTSPLLPQALHWVPAEKQQQQLRCNSGHLGSQDGGGGFRGASTSTALPLQGPASGRPDISEWWQVAWKNTVAVRSDTLPWEFPGGGLCVCLYVCMHTSTSCFNLPRCFTQQEMVVHTFQKLHLCWMS